MDPREGYTEDRANTLAKRLGWLQRKVTWRGRDGAPDRLYIKGGRHVWVEWKRRGKDAEPHQLREHAAMRAAGAEVYVLDNLADFERILRRDEEKPIWTGSALE